MTNIVERLRAVVDKGEVLTDSVALEAADEIEQQEDTIQVAMRMMKERDTEIERLRTALRECGRRCGRLRTALREIADDKEGEDGFIVPSEIARSALEGK